MEFIEVVFTTKYGNFIMRFYKEGMFSDLSVGDVMNIIFQSFLDSYKSYNLILFILSIFKERMGIYEKSIFPIVKR